MDIIEVTRTKPISITGSVHGKIMLNGVAMGVTLEKGEKIITADTYFAKVHNSNRFARKVILFEDAHNRTYIEIHAGNSISDTTGCILIGTSKHKDQIWHSVSALENLLKNIKTPDRIKVIVR